MDNRAGEMEVFVAAAELQSFSAAGRRLKLSPSAVSKLVTRIEDRLGNAPSRAHDPHAASDAGRGNLSGPGATFLADIAETERVVAGGGQWFREACCASTLPSALANATSSRLPTFLELYPEVELDISLTDGIIDLIEERADIAIRSGAMDDSSLKARKLLESQRVIVASPAYLELKGIPETPQDLATIIA